MITTAKSMQHHIVTGVTTLLLGASLLSTPARADAQVRLQSTTDNGVFSEGYSLSVEDWSAKTRSARTSKLRSFHHQNQDRPQVWISDIGTLLFDDLDGDGYHSGFSVTIDVDSEFGDTEVYAKIYLEPTDASSTLLYTTNRFSIYGTTIGDEYRVDTELRNNFIADDYNVSIDIHDAWSDELLDTANQRGFSNLKQLPLESTELNQRDEELDYYNSTDDQHNSADDQHSHGDGSADVVVTEYAGLFHPLLLLALTGGVFIRRRQR